MVFANSLYKRPQLVQSAAEEEMSVRVSRLQPENVLESTGSFFILPEFGMHETQREVQLCKFGSQPKRLRNGFDG